MPSYVVTGASRGLGFGFISSLSSNPANTVIGFVRNVETARSKVSRELPNRDNLHIVRGDLDDYQSLQGAFETTSGITGGVLDCLMANAGISSSGLESLTELGEHHAALDKQAVDIFHTNVVGNINLVNLALPLLKKGTGVRKVVMISSGLGDPAFIADNGIFESPLYSISKAALDMVVAKYHAEYHSQGILFMGISPGVVDTQELPSEPDIVLPAMQEKQNAFFAKFARYAPHFAGPDSVETSVRNVLGVVERATIEDEGGRTVSHLGTRQWL